MSCLRTSILLIALIATVYGQFNVGPFNSRLGIPLRLNVNRESSTNQNVLTSTMINLQKRIRSKDLKN